MSIDAEQIKPTPRREPWLYPILVGQVKFAAAIAAVVASKGQNTNQARQNDPPTHSFLASQPVEKKRKKPEQQKDRKRTLEDIKPTSSQVS